jgi:hypothetical protein
LIHLASSDARWIGHAPGAPRGPLSDVRDPTPTQARPGWQEHRPPFARSVQRVDTLAQRAQDDLALAKLADSCHHLGGVAAQPIYPDDDDGVADLARRLEKVSRRAKQSSDLDELLDERSELTGS